MPSQRLPRRSKTRKRQVTREAEEDWGRYQQRRKDDNKNAKKEKAAR
jgi:hypothetical protein